MIGSGGIATYAISGLTVGTVPIVGFVDEIATREQRLLQPYAWLEFYEIETTSSGTLRYVDFQDPDAGGTLTTQVAFNGDDYSSRKIKRGAIKTSDGVAQFSVEFEDVDRELMKAVDLDDGLNTEKMHLHRIPYDLIATKPQLAVTDTFRIRQALASLGPDTVSLSVGLPSLAEFELPNRIISRNRCWNDFNRRFQTDSFCRYPSDDFELGSTQVFGSDTQFATTPTSWPATNTQRKNGWHTINANHAAVWKTAFLVSGTRWTVCNSNHANLKWGEVSEIDQALTITHTFVDVTSALNDSGSTTSVFPATPTLDDSIYFGSTNRFNRLQINMATAGVGDYELTWEYLKSGTFVALSGLSTNSGQVKVQNFKTAGTKFISFTQPSDWSIDGTHWFIRARISKLGFTTVPLMRQAWTFRFGGYVAMDSVKTRDAGVSVDITADMNNPATTTLPFSATPEIDDAIVFGGATPFETITINVDTAGTGAYVIKWEYYNGAFVPLTVTDGTSSFKTAGTNNVTFTAPTDWARATSGDRRFLVKARLTDASVTIDPVLRQAWTENAHHGPYMYKNILGDFDVETEVDNTGTRAQRMIGFLLQDAGDESDWLFWGNVLNSSAVEKMRVRQSTNGIPTDTDFDLTDGNEKIRITRIGTQITAYSRVLDTDSWVQKSVKTWTGAPTTMRVGLVVASDVSASTTCGANFKFFKFSTGGFVDCDRSEADCIERENLHQFNGFGAIPNQRTRG